MPSVTSTLDTAALMFSASALLIFPVELWRLWRKRQLKKTAIWEMLASASPALLSALTASITTAFILRLWGPAWSEPANATAWGPANVAPWRIPTTLWTVLPALLLVDLLYYIDHRAGHRIRLYWAIAHSVHHSSSQFDQSTGLRVSFVDGFISPWFYLPAIAIGFDPMLIASCFGFILLYQQWLHTELIGKLPLLDSWLNTPSNHRVHHGVQDMYLDKNYGAVLMIWDRFFGTYQAELDHIPTQYGLTTPIGSSNPITVHLSEARRMLTALRQLRSFSKAVRFLFEPPSTANPTSVHR